MKKYEKLFSIDPIGAFEKIEEDYARYFREAFKLSNKSLDDERMDTLVNKDNNMSKEPYIEVLPEYAPNTSVSSMNDLVTRFTDSFGNKEISRRFFEDFISKGLMQGLMKDYQPHGHQVGMMEKAFAGIGDEGQDLKYKNTVITSGTGSGKTESFLLPLLADIFKEAQNWGPAANHSKWYNSTIYEPSQRKGDTRPHALRALVLYPMNALVEDQMARLREALDHDDVRDFMEKNLNGNRIYFGSYNGSTIGKKSYEIWKTNPDTKKLNGKRKEMAVNLAKIHGQFEFAKKYYSQNNGKEEVLYISPRLGEGIEVKNDVTAEMVTRWDMQEWAPDIMITNTSMLSIMLMRKAEEKIFDDTREWLAGDPDKDNPTRIFHIVVDELHLYRGTAGSEVACLLRMLYKALGLKPVIEKNGEKVPNPQIKILASSASLGDEKDTQKFMEEFFGLYSTIKGDDIFNVQKGFNYIDHIGDFEHKKIDYSVFGDFTHEGFVALTNDELEIENKEDLAKVVLERQTKFAREFVKKHFDIDDLQSFTKKYEKQIFSDFYYVLPENTDHSRRPISQSELRQELFGGDEKALRGFLIFRGFIDNVVKDHKLPRFRFHKFFKYVEGLWGELQPNMTTGTAPVAHLSYTAEEVGPNNRKVLELLRCENCGQLFIGGNRKVQNTISLTLNYPSLDQIPNFNPTPMVQNKNYQDYAIFWPHDISDAPSLTSGNVTQGANDHVVRITDGDSRYSNGQASWQAGYLDAMTGEFTDIDHAKDSRTHSLNISIQKNGIPGFLYRVVEHENNKEVAGNIGSMIYAAPCTCPHCLQDYTTRKYTNSPIRSFRTGIDRSNQLLSKELLYQLDEKSSKLIGFSDSREDAAKQALGIEREQYRDMVRMLFVECVNEVGSAVDDVVSFIESEKQKCNGNFAKMIQIPSLAQSQFPNINNALQIATDYLSGQDISKYKSTTIPIAKLTGDRFEGPLVKKLLERGINPAGESYKFQGYDQNVGNKVERKHWSTAYDFNSYCFNNNFLTAYGAFGEEIKKQLESAVFANSFGKFMGVSVLDAGIGYISCPQDDAIKKMPEYKALRQALPISIDVFQFVDAFIRVMGDNYLYPNENTADTAVKFSKMKAVVRRPITQFLERNPSAPADLGDILVAFLKKSCTTEKLLLDFNKLAFTMMTEEKYIVCPKCGRVHPNLGFGFCTNTYCMEELKPDKTKSTDSLHEHYISHDILVEPREPKRLHTEELSGQTDDIQTRLHEFKDLILEDDGQYKLGYDKTKSIDMICVTTTMEVGVDIGSLQAIMQGNMPPTRYNYQQRVGRGGRRGQAFSTAFTFCRGRSHDVYYYSKATDEMVGGIPATPTLSLAPYTDDGKKKMKVAIMKRVIAKEILHQAFINRIPYHYELQDTAGEFGIIGEWKYPLINGQTTMGILVEWLKNNKKTVSDTVHRYFDQFNIDHSIDTTIQEIIGWIMKTMVSQIDAVVQKTSVTDAGLAKYLSESGFLPMYGMPSDSRNFYHGYDVSNKKVKSIDRSSEMAISEFAPGAEKTKDKGKYRVEGLTIAMKDEAEDKEHINFYDSDGDGDALSDSYIISMENDIDPGKLNNNIKDIIEIDKNNPFDAKQISRTLGKKQRLIVIPQAYRSLQIGNNTGTPVDNNDKGSSFVQTQIFAKDNSSSNNSKDVQNVKISIYELGLSDDPTIWHVNNNNGLFYKGEYNADGMENPLSGHANFMFYEEHQQNNKIEVRKKNTGIEIALGSKKITEMIKLELKSYPDTINLSLQTGNKSAIRAAFYSAAFLLQRALADKLDVQPDEIEICEKIDDQHDYPVIYLSDALANGAGIVSYLYQGDNLEKLIKSIVNFDTFDAGKTSKEKSFMQTLISDEHRNSCLTACQKCLMAYNNRGFHHILDWRLGVGILRLMIDRTYSFGMDDAEITKFEELVDQKVIIQKCASKLSFIDDSRSWEENSNGAAGVRSAKVVYHPLWNRETLISRLQSEGLTAPKVSWFNTFKVLRSDLSEDSKIIIPTITTSNNSSSSSQSPNNVLVTTTTTNKPSVSGGDQNNNTFGIPTGQSL